MALISAAIFLGSAAMANEARKARKSASESQVQQLKKQAEDAELMRQAIDAQTAAYAKTGASLEQQADIAKRSFEASQAQYAENKLMMERQAEEVRKATDEERRKAAQSEATALRARTRGGRRALLSQERTTPELGITSPMLGSQGMI
jgi:type IV secretory pathway VirB10-like protein